MATTSRPRPSVSVVLSLLALLVATAGTSYAAGALPRDSVGTLQLRTHAVTRAKIAPATVRQLKGNRGRPGPAGPRGRSALTPLRRGETVRGTWGVSSTTAATSDFDFVSFPVPAPKPVDDAHVSLAGFDPKAGAGCTGTAAAPVAGPGFVCLYVSHSQGTTNAHGFGALHPGAAAGMLPGSGSTAGFQVFAYASASDMQLAGTWAYTAP